MVCSFYVVAPFMLQSLPRGGSLYLSTPLTCSFNQSAHSSMPSPVLAQMGMTFAFGLRMATYSSAFVQVKIKVRHHVDFVHKHDVAYLEHQRVFQRLVVALWHRQNHGVLHCARWSNSAGQTRLPTFSRIAKSMSPVPRPSNPLPGHFGVKVAHTAGMQLDRLCPGPGDGAGIHIGVNVRFHHTDAQLIFEGCNGSAQRRGFAGPRCALSG